MKKILKKIIKNICIGLCAAALFSGCGKAENTGSQTEGDSVEQSGMAIQDSAAAQNNEGEATPDMLFSECEYLTREMYERATAYQEGDLSRIAAAMRKAEAGEAVTIGVIGGSITQGSSATGQDGCYAALLEKWWEDTFPEAEITFINAGVGGTGSYLGVHRVEEDLLSCEPDFGVGEFSVNDGNRRF